MISLHPKSLREFNRQLFADTLFDDFLVPEAHFVTSFRSDFSGQLPAEKTEDGAPPSAPACIRWAVLRRTALELVRGTEAPKNFSVVLKLPEEKLWDVLPEEGAEPEEVSGLYLNIRYLREELSVTTGCSLKTFSLDRTWEKAWDKSAEEMLEKAGLV